MKNHEPLEVWTKSSILILIEWVVKRCENGLNLQAIQNEFIELQNQTGKKG